MHCVAISRFTRFECRIHVGVEFLCIAGLYGGGHFFCPLVRYFQHACVVHMKSETNLQELQAFVFRHLVRKLEDYMGFAEGCQYLPYYFFGELS